MEPYEVEAFWDDLLGFIEQRRVIPIIGAELLKIQNGVSTIPAEEVNILENHIGHRESPVLS
jgi:hypothetical protein